MLSYPSVEKSALNESSKDTPFTVLLADDEWLLCWSLERLLVRHGIRVLIAPSGNAALELMRAQPVGWVITDLKMPDLSGLELLELVRSQYPGVRTALMTAYGSAEIEAQARRLGASYLPKPFKLDDIVALVLPNHSVEA